MGLDFKPLVDQAQAAIFKRIYLILDQDPSQKFSNKTTVKSYSR